MKTVMYYSGNNVLNNKNLCQISNNAWNGNAYGFSVFRIYIEYMIVICQELFSQE